MDNFSHADGYLDQKTQYLLEGREIINIEDCPGDDGEMFGNCIMDEYCMNNNLHCNGTCTW